MYIYIHIYIYIYIYIFKNNHVGMCVRVVCMPVAYSYA